MGDIKVYPTEGYGAHIRSVREIAEKVNDMPSAANVATDGTSLADVIALAEAGKIAVGSKANTTEYNAGTGIGGNSYTLVDAGSSGARPAADGGSVIHVTGGSGFLYLYQSFSVFGVYASQFGAYEGNAAASNGVALQNAVTYCASNKRTLLLESGVLLTDRTLGKITNAITIKGQGITRSVIQLTPSMTGWALEVKETGFVISGWTRDDDTIDYNADVSGVTLESFSIVGDKTNSQDQGGVRFIDRNDNIKTRDFWVQFCSLGGLKCGDLEDRTVGYIRESEFDNLQIRMCGNRDNPAFNLGASGTGDATNQVNFYGLKIVWPFGEGLVINNLSTTNAIRRIYFFGAMIHGQEVAVGTGKDLISLVGEIDSVNMYGLRGNACESGAFSLALKADGSGNYPNSCYFDLSVTTGFGGGVKIDGGRNHTVFFDSLFVNEDEINVGAAVDGGISFIGNVKDTWTVTADSVVANKWLSSYFSESNIPPRFERIKMGTDSEFQPEILVSVGTPEGVVSAPTGSICLNRQGSADRNSDQLYMKFSGTGNTGWYPCQAVVSGTTAQRPASPTANQMYIDTTLGHPVWYISSAWVDSSGVSA